MDNNGFNEYTPQGEPYSPQPPQRERPYYRPRDFRAAARRALKGFWLMAIVVTLVAGILGGVSISGFPPDFTPELNVEEMQTLPDAEGNPILTITEYVEQVNTRYPFLKTIFAISGVLAAIQLLVGGPVMLGYTRFKLHRLDGQEAKFGDVFSCFDQFIEGLWMRVRTLLQIILWSLLFIIPGIVAAYRYAMVPYLMADHPGMSVSDAFAVSKRLMKGRKADLFLLHLSYIGWWFVSALTLGIGALVVAPYMSFAEAAFYRNISSVDPN